MRLVGRRPATSAFPLQRDDLPENSAGDQCLAQIVRQARLTFKKFGRGQLNFRL